MSMSDEVIDCSVPAITLAEALLGCELLRVEPDGSLTGGVIVETEAYPGGEDLASHSAGGRRTNRNASMYLAGGHLYVYLIYGMHHCLNVVSGPSDSGEAVLVRSLRPTRGLDRMRARRDGRPDRELARGPGRLCAALGVDRGLDGRLLGSSGGVVLRPGDTPESIVRARRVGVEYAGTWARRRWRFLYGRQSEWSSRPRGAEC